VAPHLWEGYSSLMLGYEPARPTFLPKNQIQALAESANKRVSSVSEFELFSVVEAMGGRIAVEDTLLTDPKRAGSLFVDGERDFRIIVPSHTSPERDQFTIAHEFGHYILHYLWQRRQNPTYPEKVFALRRGSDRIEWEANWFAAAFLMPAIEFKAAHKKYRGDLRAIAEYFFVSFKAAEIRGRDLIGG
jgi:Zn-dependent peptidase ImmA (M78 family)